LAIRFNGALKGFSHRLLGGRTLSSTGFDLAAPEGTPALLMAHWTVSDRQVETSVVLVKPPVDKVTGPQ